MNKNKIVTGLVLTSMLSGCGWFYGEDGLIKDSRYDYLKAQTTQEIVMPEGLTQENKADYTPIPAIGEKAKQAPTGKDLKLSAPTQILAVLDNVRTDKNAPFPAVFVIEESDFLWDSVIDLFKANQANISVQDKANSVIETDWLAIDERGLWLGIAGSEEIDEFRAKFQISFSKGVLNGEQRIEVKRIAAEKYDDATDSWKPVPSFWEDGADMMNMIIAHYDLKDTERNAQKREAMVAGFKVQLAKDEKDDAALVTDADVEHVWEKLPKVLEALNFDINDKDRRLMTYFVSYKPQEPGFFASLFGDEQQSLPLAEGDYQIGLRALGERTAIVFSDGQGAPLKANVLTKLYPQLSSLFGSRR